VHLQPVLWKDDWPVIGEEEESDGIGAKVGLFTLNSSLLKSPGIFEADWFRME